ncbi:MAG: 2-oxoglutarate dehydrogenase E1 component [Pirellulaceae bacterium]
MDSALSSLNVAYLESLLALRGQDSAALAPEWQQWLDDQQRPLSASGPPSTNRQPSTIPSDSVRQERVDQLIRAYREQGHRIAALDPLGRAPEQVPELELQSHGLAEADLGRTFSTAGLAGPASQTLAEIIERLKEAYCGPVGIQVMHIDDRDVRRWVLERWEDPARRSQLSAKDQRRIFARLTDAVVFERFVRKKYVGAKTFSLEGAESLIPLLDLAIEKAAGQGIEEIVMGMAHRGRLNVLTNIIGKQPREIFFEFEDRRPEAHRGSGDVKYHLGFSGDWQAVNGRQVHLSMCFNPSHLEFVNPVALGRLRAKQDRSHDRQRCNGLALLIHGDASFAGEGIVAETLNLSELPAYQVGGALHIIVNNQVGFTTSPAQGRSTRYATDVARMLQTPIFHVNGEHPDAVAQVIDIAMEFRATFQRDVVVDMLAYRRWGHNEVDEPSFTQPIMYQAIEHRRSVRDVYLDHLLEKGDLTREEADEIARSRRKRLRAEFDQVQREDAEPSSAEPQGVWKGYTGGSPNSDDDAVETAVDGETLSRLLNRLATPPDDFHPHRKLTRGMQRRHRMADGQEPVDWAAAEAMAVASLAAEGHPIRLAGQDTQRGTFSQRHAVLHDVVDGHEHLIFSGLADQQESVEIINSPLSEAAATGFEYGYSLDRPNALVAWEAQYGDFANAAQVIIDQFLASAEDKWRRLSGLTLLLPHGFEGQGPEHSSARLERFLVMATEYNWQVAIPSTPAQYFHLLRRQVKRSWRKPLIVMTPKSLLRHSQMQSPWVDFTSGRFQHYLPDDLSPKKVRRVLLCSGKVGVDLRDRRNNGEADNVAVLRIEQLYPLSDEQLRQMLEPYPDAELMWVQEEPSNMGALPYWRMRFGDRWAGDRPWTWVARHPSASPATGSSASHQLEQAELLDRAFA